MSTPYRYGYARVSTTKQDLDRQVQRLLDEGIPSDRIFVDKKSGKNLDREGLTTVTALLRPGDQLVVCTFDRLGRTVRECLNYVHDRKEEGVGIKTLADPVPIDTLDNSLMAELSTLFIAMFAHMERVFMLERVANARAARERSGKRPGREPKLSPAQERRLVKAYRNRSDDATADDIARDYHVSRATLYRLLKRYSEEAATDLAK